MEKWKIEYVVNCFIHMLGEESPCTPMECPINSTIYNDLIDWGRVSITEFEWICDVCLTLVNAQHKNLRMYCPCDYHGQQEALNRAIKIIQLYESGELLDY